MQQTKHQESDQTDIDFAKLHQSVFPADVRDGENLKASFRESGSTSGSYIESRVWRLSPVGIELLVEPEAAPTKSTKLDMILVIGGQRSKFEGVVVDCFSSHQDLLRVGVRLCRLTTPHEGEDRRRSARWVCSSQYHPTAVAQNPAKFNDYLYFKIKDISANGLQLVTSLRNKFILPGMSFDLQMSLPMVGQVAMRTSVERIGFTFENAKDYLVVGASFGSLDRATKSVIGQYILQFCENTSLEDLVSAGFVPESVARAVTYAFVRSESDYQQVLNLRETSYKLAGKSSAELETKDFADVFDSRSRILLARYRNQVVATARLTFAELGEKLEIERDTIWRENFPRRENCVEVSRTCTSPDYRGSDLLFSLFHQIAITTVQAGRRWIVIGASEKESSLYQRIGFTSTGVHYRHTAYGGLKHQVMLGDTPSVMKGIGVGPIAWHAIWKDVSGYLLDNKLIEMDGLSSHASLHIAS